MRASPALKQRFVKYLAQQVRTRSLELEGERPECLQCFAGMDSEESIEAELLPRVVDWGIHDWEHEPHGGAFHVWRPGVKTWEVMARLKAFGPGNRLHIVGEAFSDYQGFIEGCLNSADAALATLPKPTL